MYSFRLTEEIARWAFEVICNDNPDWYIAFTNPTAGPWKTIKCTSCSGTIGEVYRFELEETRPDILLVNDKLKLVIIFEAKDSLIKLTSGTQAEKSVEVVAQLSNILIGKSESPFWGVRSNYNIITGLLWGAEVPSNAHERNAVFDAYHKHMVDYPNMKQRIIIGIETSRKGDGLECTLYGKSYEKIGLNPIDLNPIASSFNIPMI